jgi:hypothetical protein
MRYLIFVLLFSLPCAAGASVAVPISIAETAIARQAIPHGFAPKKQGFFERVTEKMLQKRLKKSRTLPYGNNGKRLCIAGFVIGLVVLLGSPLWAGLIYYYGIVFLILTFLLSLTGLCLSILGLLKARGWEGTRTLRILAIIGIVLNALIFLPSLLLLRIA